MAQVKCGRIYIEWDDGEEFEIAEVSIDQERIGKDLSVRTKVYRIPFGWEFIRMGLRIMMHGWKGNADGQ